MLLIEDALKEEAMKIDASKIHPTPSGEMAAEAAGEADTKEATDQLNTVAHATGYTAEGTANKHGRLINRQSTE